MLIMNNRILTLALLMLVTVGVLPLPGISNVTDNVTLNSTLNSECMAHNGTLVIFMCVTKCLPILEWYSPEYIGSNGEVIQLLSVGNTEFVQSSVNDNTNATRTNVTKENNCSIIVSTLHVTASIQYPSSRVSCGNRGAGTNRTIMFYTIIEKQLWPTSLYTMEGSRELSTSMVEYNLLSESDNALGQKDLLIFSNIGVIIISCMPYLLY